MWRRRRRRALLISSEKSSLNHELCVIMVIRNLKHSVVNGVSNNDQIIETKSQIATTWVATGCDLMTSTTKKGLEILEILSAREVELES
jgi:hypothetical protein